MAKMVVDTFYNGDLVDCRVGDKVEVTVPRPYGSLTIRVSEIDGKLGVVSLISLDGDGHQLNGQLNVDPDDLVDPEKKLNYEET